MWIVQLTGDPGDLAALAQSLTSDEIQVSREEEDYILTSTKFDAVREANNVLLKAKDIVAFLNGACRLVLDSVEPVGIGSVYRRREDGTREFHLFAEGGTIHLRASSPTVTLTRADGTTEVMRPADLVNEWAMLAMSESAISDVLRFFGTGKLDWVNLYRIFEIITDDVGGLDPIVGNGWATRSSMRLFKQTANSPGAIGDEARHSVESTQPPPNPMSLSEARALVSAITHAWIRSKAAAP